MLRGKRGRSLRATDCWSIPRPDDFHSASIQCDIVIDRARRARQTHSPPQETPVSQSVVRSPRNSRRNAEVFLIRRKAIGKMSTMLKAPRNRQLQEKADARDGGFTFTVKSNLPVNARKSPRLYRDRCVQRNRRKNMSMVQCCCAQAAGDRSVLVKSRLGLVEILQTRSKTSVSVQLPVIKNCPLLTGPLCC